MTRDLALGCALSVKLKLRGMTHMTKMREGRNLKSSKRLKSKIKVETFRTRVVLTYNNLTINFPTIDAKDVGDKLTKAMLIQKSQKYQRIHND